MEEIEESLVTLFVVRLDLGILEIGTYGTRHISGMTPIQPSQLTGQPSNHESDQGTIP